MTEWIPPQELNQPVPRCVGPNGSLKFTIILFSAVFLIMTMLTTAVAYDSAHTMEILKTRGIATDGKIVGLRAYEAINSARSRYYADYQFKPSKSSGAESLINKIKESVSRDVYYKLNVGESVPVIYDPSDPFRSSLNFDDKVHTRDSYKPVHDLFEYIFPVIAALFAFIMTAFLPGYYKEKGLLKRGIVTSAKIIDQQEYRSRIGPLTAVTYQFTDKNGKVIQGFFKGLPCKAAAERQKNFREMLSKAFNNTTVLYDPRNSKKNMLYQPTYAVCYLPQSGRQKSSQDLHENVTQKEAQQENPGNIILRIGGVAFMLAGIACGFNLGGMGNALGMTDTLTRTVFGVFIFSVGVCNYFILPPLMNKNYKG